MAAPTPATARLLIFFQAALITASTSLAAPANDTLTAQECQDFSDQWIAAIRSGDTSKCSLLYDCDAFVETLFEGVEFEYADRQAVLDDWKERLRESHILYAAIVSSASAGSIEVLSIHPADQRRHIVARCIDQEAGLQYFMLTIARSEDGRIRIVDFDSAAGGGSLRDTLRTTFVQFARYDGPDGKIIKEAPSAERMIYDKRVLAGMQAYLKQAKLKEVIHLYGELSPTLQSQRYPLLMAIAASIAAYDEANQNGLPEVGRSYDQSVQQLSQTYRRLFPNDPTIDMLLIDCHVSAGRFDAAEKSIDAIDQWVAGDPYLDTLRAGVAVRRNELSTARSLAERSLRNGSHSIETYNVLATIADLQGDESRAAAVRKEAATRHGLAKGLDAEVVE